MIPSWTSRLVLLGPWARAGTALVAGAATALALAPLFWWWVPFLTFPVLVFLLDGAEGQGGPWRRSWPAFATGWAFGFGYFVAGLWWIGAAFLVEAEEFAWALPLAVAGLPALLALFHGAAALAARALGGDGWTRVLALAAAFAAAEWLRGNVMTGFPWNGFGYLLMPSSLLMQPAALWGAYGVTFVALLLFAAPALLVCPEEGDRPAFGALAILALAHLGWAATVDAPAPAADPVRLRIVQPAVDQREKWAEGQAAPMFRRHVSMSAAEPLQGVDYVVWPESAFAFMIQKEPTALAAIADILPPGTKLVTGAMRGADWDGRWPGRVWNSVMVIDDEGVIEESGDKTHLVPFGEYLPFADLLGRLGLRQLAARGAFETSTGRVVLQRGTGAAFLPLVCYEIIFPGVGRTVADGARPDFLLNVTNDGWFGLTSGPYQHAHQARVRGVEEGLPVVRAANSGVSFVSDARGRIVARLALGARDVVDAGLPAPAAATPYTRWGEWPLGAALVLSCAVLLWRRRRTARTRGVPLAVGG